MNINYTSGLVIVTGPVKSGKSIWAEKIIAHNHGKVTYIATSSIYNNDEIWKKRIQIHKERRPKEWNLVESADIFKILTTINQESSVLIDSLGGIITKSLTLNNEDWHNHRNLIVNAISTFKGLIVIVCEEVGWGVSPATHNGNLFRDRLGDLVDRLDQFSLDSWLVIHGRAINIYKNSIRI
ncbi:MULTISPECIES: bifunctional adenosylcobinamide kinase/adenosylcobinamide-phosphate guanylyltransferase [unclassified Prochlorococcus]|uniref:bifunctional adenosylcobinamide kinase/adenosylcobinamide-phosphate guanylyltransferase n=1 Tax=unclassified Prochlorococcus TaxID=2627481 RepID=UPI0005338264|nr:MULTISPECIES: bifunctional adenosylcobinamide kinase/adenosylcobinamide-phosphate guanylyltransferase [unclassified Prochlorococcus]KGG15295.1 Adenosylcobinamide-phosphate guanylyltransferase [Prochlorococcus sp. MIT 0602]KGG17573.1 Adenosylcobinamide-phosphate guanylyltransferase [Prochlorococcus sp. MIT 0603]